MIIAQTDILDQAEKASHLNDRALFFLVVILLGGVIIYLFRDAKKTAERVADEHAKSIASLMAAMEEHHTAMEEERKQRIEMLLDVIKTNAISNQKMADAIEVNTKAVTELRLAIEHAFHLLNIERKPQ